MLFEFGEWKDEIRARIMKAKADHMEQLEKLGSLMGKLDGEILHGCLEEVELLI